MCRYCVSSLKRLHLLSSNHNYSKLQQLCVIELGTQCGTSESNQLHCSDRRLSQHHSYRGHSTWLEEFNHKFNSHIPLGKNTDSPHSQSDNLLCRNTKEWLTYVSQAVKSCGANNCNCVVVRPTCWLCSNAQPMKDNVIVSKIIQIHDTLLFYIKRFVHLNDGVTV